MHKIVLVSCASKKLNYKSRAEDLYISPLFKMNLKFARSLNPDKIFILSAKYGLVDLEREIEPYDITLRNMTNSEKIKWSMDVLNRLKEVSNIKEDEFIFLAGREYRKNLIKYIVNYKVPMENLGIGKQLKYLKDRLK